jgi:hypothetical protein
VRTEVRGYASIAAGTVYSAIPREDIPDDLYADLQRMKERYDYQRHGDMTAEHASLITDRILDAVAIAGTPDEAVPRFRELMDLGVENFVLPIATKHPDRIITTLAERVPRRDRRDSRHHAGFQAFDAHELLCHFGRCRPGYTSQKIAVPRRHPFVTDRTAGVLFRRLQRGLARGAGRPEGRVRGGRPADVLDRSRAPLAGVAGLARGRLATYPPVAPPHALANIVLRKAGLEVALDGRQDVTLLPARDDVARLGLLRSGSVDAAVISSAIAPARMAGLGFHSLCFIGDELRLPTTGLEIHQAHLGARRTRCARVDIHREACFWCAEPRPDRRGAARLVRCRYRLRHRATLRDRVHR